MSPLQQALAAAERRTDATISLLRQWVETNSYSAEIANVNQMGQQLEQAFSLPELAGQRRTGNETGDHLFWHTPSWTEQPSHRLLLVGHHDTVFPPGDFEGWSQTGDRISGPGTLDMKGGLAVVHTALSALSEIGELARVPLGLVSVGDEEIGSPDSQRFTGELARGAAAALVFEAGRAKDAIITRRKGTGGIRATVTGTAAHAGNCHADGRNAIWALARFVDTVQRFTDYEHGVTVNVGRIQGGTSRNTVPASAHCDIDLRFEQAADGRGLVTAIERIAHELAEGTGCTIELTGGIRRPPLERTPESTALYQRYAACARESGLGDTECPLLGGGSDGNNVAALGVPVIDGLGPRGFGFHTHDEYIEASSLPLRTAALVRFLLSW